MYGAKIMDLPKISEMTAGMDMTTVYGLIGVIVVAQFGTLVTVMIWVMKGVWWASKKDVEVERLKSDMNAAFVKLRNGNSEKNEGCSDERSN